MTASLAPRPGAPAPSTKVLVDYEVKDGLAIITLNDPPANTYTYEMMRQLDAAILDARMADEAHVIVLRGHGEKFFSGRRQHRDAQRGDAAVQVLLLPARQRDAEPAGADARS